MKRLRISKLMDEYTDTEFFPTGGSAIDPEVVKARVLANVKTAAKKKPMPRKKKVLLAAALAASLVLLVGAGYPYFQHRLVGGALSFEQKSNERMTSLVHYNSVVEPEDGRLFFNRDDGQRIDITDLVSMETPYIYDGSDPDTGMIYYTVMGGTPEAYGWLEWIQVPYPFDDSNLGGAYALDFDENGNPVMIIYDFEFNDGIVGMGNGGVSLDEIYPPLWLLSAVDKLGIPVRESPEFE